MKKQITLFVKRNMLAALCLFLCFFANQRIVYATGVATNYSFLYSSYNSGVYTQLTGTNFAPLTTGAAVEHLVRTVTLHFPFSFNGITYTTPTVSIYTNGFITIGTTTSTGISTVFTPLTSTSLPAAPGVVAGFAGNLLPGAAPNLCYTTIKDPNTSYPSDSIFVVQWTDYQINAGDDYNFQIRLNQADNSVQVIYGAMTTTSTTESIQVGLRGASTSDINCQNVASGLIWTNGTRTPVAAAPFGPNKIPVALTYLWENAAVEGGVKGGTSNDTIANVEQTEDVLSERIGANIIDANVSKEISLNYTINSVLQNPVAMILDDSSGSSATLHAMLPTIPAQIADVTYFENYTNTEGFLVNTGEIAFRMGALQVTPGSDMMSFKSGAGTIALSSTQTASNVALRAASTISPIKITQVTLNEFGSGNTGGYPSYIGDTMQKNFIEIRNLSNASLDISGFTIVFESMMEVRTFTIPANQPLLNGLGNAIFNVGMAEAGYPNDSAFHFYNMGGTEAPLTTGDAVGIILKNQNGDVLDAFAGNGFAFNGSQGEKASDWFGFSNSPVFNNSAGFMRNNPIDHNCATDWVAANDSGVVQSIGAPTYVLDGAFTAPVITWTSVDFGNFTGETITVPPLDTGSYNFTATAAHNSATVTAPLSIIVHAPVHPVAAFYADSTNTVIYENVMFQDTSSGYPESWFWEFGDGTTSTLQNPTHVYTTPGVYTTTLTVTNADGIDSAVKVNYIDVQNYSSEGPPPDSIFTAGTLTAFISCSGTPSSAQTFTVAGSGLSNNLVVTAPAGFEISTDGSNFSPTYSFIPSSGAVSTTTIYVRLTSTASGTPSGNVACTSTPVAEQDIVVNGTVNPRPTAVISGGGAICSGSPGTVTITFTGTAPFTYALSDGITSGTTSNNPATITVLPSSGTTYTVSSLSDANCTSNAGDLTGSATVNVNPLPTATISANGTPVCENGTSPSVTFTGSGSTAPYTYSYSINNVAQTPVPDNGSGSLTFQIPTGTPGQFVYILTGVQDASSTECSQSISGQSATVTINALPLAIISAASMVTAESTGNIASVDNAGTGATYSWSITNGTITAGTGTNSITYTVGATGDVSLSVSVTGPTPTDCSPVSSGILEVPITKLPCPNPAISTPWIVCSSSTGNTASVAKVSGDKYVWTISNGTITAGSGTNSITYTAGASGFVTLSATVTNASGQCTVSSGKYFVFISPLPSASISAPASVCTSSTGNIAWVPGAGIGATYAWTISNGTITSGSSINAVAFNANASGTITLSVTVTNIAGCKTSSGTKSVSIVSYPVATITAASSVCSSSSGNVASVASAGSGAKYAWSISNGVITSGSNTNSITYTAARSGTVTLSVTVTNSSGCMASSGTVKVAINAPVTPTFANIPALCVAAKAPALPTTSLNGISGTWKPSTISTASKGTTQYVFTPASGVCASSVTISVTVQTCVTGREEGIAPSANVEFVAYPNPAHDRLNVDFNVSKNGDYLIKMFDITGRLLFNKIATAQAGDNHLEFDIGNYAKGLYILSFSSGDESRQVRVVVE